MDTRKLLTAAALFAAAMLSGCGGGGGGGGITLTPEEREYRSNYGLARINANAAYAAGAFGQGVVVGVADTGMLTSHIDLRQNVVAGYDFVADTPIIDDPDGHGTLVAGVIGGVRGNGDIHGVAPSVSLMPLQIGDRNGDLTGNFIKAFNYAAARNVHVINASFGDIGQLLYGTYQRENYWLEVPFWSGFFNDRSRNVARNIVKTVRGHDTVIVWAAGNDGWRPNNRVAIRRALCNDASRSDCISDIGIRQDIDNILSEFIGEAHTDEDGISVGGIGRLSDAGWNSSPLSSYYSSVPLWAFPNIDQLVMQLADGTLSEDEFGRLLLADSNFIGDTERWLAVVATDENNQIAGFSNGCGVAAGWCVAAPGKNIYTTGNTNNNNYDTVDGTSFAAPHVSGALAVLKSAKPSLPMAMIRAILLTSATDLGERDVDEIYGWGLVNISAGIRHIEKLQTAQMAGFAPVKLSALEQEFPARFAHLREKMGELTIAIEITDGAYYNMPLADIIPPQTEKQINFGNAAEKMLTENTETQKSGFAAFGDSSAGFGLRWNDTYENAGMWAELSYAPKTAGIVGAETGAKIGIRRPLFGGIFAFGEYGGGFAKTQTGESGYISAAESIKTEEWTAGVDYLDLLQKNDKLRFAVRQGKRISGGKIAVNLPVAAGDFYKSFLGEKLQDLEIARAEISLTEKAPLIFSAGYSVQRNKSEWAAAAEYAKNGKGKLSAKWKINL